MILLVDHKIPHLKETVLIIVTYPPSAPSPGPHPPPPTNAFYMCEALPGFDSYWASLLLIDFELGKDTFSPIRILRPPHILLFHDTAQFVENAAGIFLQLKRGQKRGGAPGAGKMRPSALSSFPRPRVSKQWKNGFFELKKRGSRITKTEHLEKENKIQAKKKRKCPHKIRAQKKKGKDRFFSILSLFFKSLPVSPPLPCLPPWRHRRRWGRGFLRMLW